MLSSSKLEKSSSRNSGSKEIGKKFVFSLDKKKKQKT